MGPLRFDRVAVIETLKSNLIFYFFFQKNAQTHINKSELLWRDPGLELYFFLHLEKHKSTENQVEPTKPHRGRGAERERGGNGTKSIITNKHSVNTATVLSAGRLQLLYGARHATYIHVTKKKTNPQKSATVQKMGQRRNGEDSVLCLEELEAMWGGFFGIHVTALLKNASKQLQDSWDWIWAHKVVTIIQTSAVWTEGSRRL